MPKTNLRPRKTPISDPEMYVLAVCVRTIKFAMDRSLCGRYLRTEHIDRICDYLKARFGSGKT